MIRSTLSMVAVFAVVLLLLPLSAPAQITTGTVTGRVIDATGAVVPGASVILVSEARGLKTAPVFTNPTGDYVFPNVVADTYTVEVTAQGFKVTRRTGIMVTGGDRVGVPPLTLEVGTTVESVTVTATAELIQTQSGERSFAITTQQIESLPIGHGNFTNLVQFTPGVREGGDSAGGTRLGGASQNNIMMDGISAMDTGNNGQMLSMNIESIGEVKILTQGYQAEYGRSSGLQITAVTKSGTNQLHGSGYMLLTDSDWNNRSWLQVKNNDPKTKSSQQIYGYTIGGPVVIPKVVDGRNKLFFFYAHEYRPTSTTTSATPIRLRVPSALERAGNFSQSRDNNGNPIPTLMDFTTGAPFPGQQIPVNRLYAPGVAVLNRYPLPTMDQAPGSNYNYQKDGEPYNRLLQQPAVRIDYQATDKLRVTGKYSAQRQTKMVIPGLIPGFSDAYVPYPVIPNWAFTANYVFSPTTFLEVTYGQIQNQLAGGNENGILVNEESNRLKSLASFPLLYPQAGVMDERYYGYKVMEAEKPPFWDGKALNLPPVWGWGSRIGAPPTQQRYPGWLNINRTRDVNVSLTKVMARHTLKGGFYLNHSYKAQNTGAGGGDAANLSFQGYVNFGNDTNNTLDSGFGFANAALGVFTNYTQMSRFIEGSMLYNQVEFFLQDNWKVTNRLTVDYGMRFVNQQPQHDQFQQMSNFFPEQWKAGDAPLLYVSGCKSGATVCSGNDRNAKDPRTGQILVVPGAVNTAAAIGTPIPGTGKALNGIQRAGEGIAKTNYVWPRLVVGPRIGFAYDLTGNSNWVFRGGLGLFYDRPDGNTVFSTPNNPPIATSQNLFNGELATLGQGGMSLQPTPTMYTFQYNAKVPSSWQWQAGVQKSLPLAMVGDVTYVGNHGYNRMGAFQGGGRQLLNAVDIGAAYLPANQDPTLGSSTIPGKTAYATNLLRPYRGIGPIEQNATEFWDTYHSLQFNVNRRFQGGFSFGANYTYGFSLKGNTGLNRRLQHAADGTISLRSDQAAYEKLMENLDVIPHLFKANGIWSSPGIQGKGAVVRELTRDWQISAVATVQSGAAYTLGYSYQNDGANVNITGSPDWAGRVVLLDLAKLGGGCSDNQYAQFDATTVRGPGYGSVGMESGRNYLRGCTIRNVDMAFVRRIRVGSERYRLELRADVFNTFNITNINGRNSTAQFNNPTSMTLVNNQFNTDGSLNQSRLKPKDAGFGAANGAMNMRNIQLQLRFQF
ncbi:MAG: carboxypeptidase regulatory-like domain-containing protein [Bryobacterales bacterium]|nr:carboxypeptidase regulatory-like domain-containing protein [Bryobacterales bacterium]